MVYHVPDDQAAASVFPTGVITHTTRVTHHSPQPQLLNESPYGRLSAFEIEKKIGRGQFSVVSRARCLIDGQVVALKKVQVCIDARSFCLVFFAHSLPHLYIFCFLFFI